ncbi:MAG: SEC-C domain-containing protein [Gammaproteobacteria bacterium]|nr:SEC-C domain-containing protein [Gammaproteobacteria bacterium]MDH5594572.1 SEC-C domain-containing protein [Gammaproteobacteria bacterium]
MTHIEIDSSDDCPCDSGLSYGECCYEKDFQWVRHENGDISRLLPIEGELGNVLENIKEQFMRVFDRVPRKNDPMILAKYLYSDADMERETIDIMKRAGTRPELIYAYKKTGGLMVTEANIDKLPTADRWEWEAAIEEYFENEGNEELYDEEDEAWASLISEIDSVIILFGYVLEYGTSPEYQPELNYSKLISPDEYSFICATRSFKTLRSIKHLLEKEIGSDSISLTRSIYENYLRMNFIRNNPGNLRDIVDAVVGLKEGTHSYPVSKKGIQNKRKIIDNSTGEEFEGYISNFRMAENSDIPEDSSLFIYIYEFLSEYTHPSFNTAHIILGPSGTFDPKNNELHHEALLYSQCFSILVLDEVRKLKMLRKEVALDILVVTIRVRNNILYLINNFIDPNNESKYLHVLKQRLNHIGT